MPKIIDHDAYKQELAGRAAVLFAEQGYSGLGMRKIAEALGLSKSALYHYFPSKKELFLACTAVATAPQETPAPTGAPCDQLMAIATDMRTGFASEMALVFDFIRGMSPADVAKDPAMKQAMSNYQTTIQNITGAEVADEILALLIGALMLDLFSGGSWSEEAIRARFDRVLAQNS